jgi:hypothetical protein
MAESEGHGRAPEERDELVIVDDKVCGGGGGATGGSRDRIVNPSRVELLRSFRAKRNQTAPLFAST